MVRVALLGPRAWAGAWSQTLAGGYRVGVLEVMRGDLRGSTAFSVACFGHEWPQDGQEIMLRPAVELRPDCKAVGAQDS